MTPQGLQADPNNARIRASGMSALQVLYTPHCCIAKAFACPKPKLLSAQGTEGQQLCPVAAEATAEVSLG